MKIKIWRLYIFMLTNLRWPYCLLLIIFVCVPSEQNLMSHFVSSYSFHWETCKILIIYIFSWYPIRVVDPEENFDHPFGLFGGKLHAGCENNGVLEIWKYLNFLYNLKSETLKVKIVKKHKKMYEIILVAYIVQQYVSFCTAICRRGPLVKSGEGLISRKVGLPKCCGVSGTLSK